MRGRAGLRDAVVALGAALLAMALEALSRFAWSGPYLPELMAQKLFALIPVWAFTPLFRTFGYNAKYYAFAGMIVVEVLGLTLAGIAIRTRMRRRRLAGRGAPWLPAAAAGPIAVVILVGLLPLLDAGIAGQALAGGVWTTVPTVVGVTGCYASVLACGVGR